jgi:uncharacterized protein (TIGR00375 family)
MIINADLHIHSHFSKSANIDMNIKRISLEAPKKGLDLVATGDCLHPQWIKEIKTCDFIDEGTFELNQTRFILSAEIEDIDRIHHLLYFYDFSKIEEFKEKIKGKSFNIEKEGKPKIDMNGEEIASIAKDVDAIIGPSHIFTPWTGVYSIKKSLSKCYRDLTNYVKFVELGLSASSDLADRIQELHRLTFLSNSDSHNPHPVRFGREFNKFKLNDLTFKEIKKAIFRINGNKPILNIGLPPQEGKYFDSACVSCNKHYDFNEAEKNNWKCSCGNIIKKGVKHQIEEKASYLEPQHPYDRPPYLYTIPLSEIITKAIGQRNPFTDISFKRWEELISVFGNEINVLFDVEINDIAKVTVPAITEAIQAFRQGDYLIKPGGGGKYGQISFPKEKDIWLLELENK